MTRLKAGRKLDALDAKIATLEFERRTIETRALGAELTDAERRERYFALPDAGQRRKLIRISRSLHDLREQQRAAQVEYWRSVATDTRAKLADLASDEPGTAWRRAIWWDTLTILWVFAGAGWLAYRIPGAIGGTAISAAWAWFIVRSRRKSRLTFIRQGEDLLRSSESELQQAERHAARAAASPPLFSAAEEETGTADAAAV